MKTKSKMKVLLMAEQMKTWFEYTKTLCRKYSPNILLQMSNYNTYKVCKFVYLILYNHCKQCMDCICVKISDPVIQCLTNKLLILNLMVIRKKFFIILFVLFLHMFAVVYVKNKSNDL